MVTERRRCQAALLRFISCGGHKCQWDATEWGCSSFCSPDTAGDDRTVGVAPELPANGVEKSSAVELEVELGIFGEALLAGIGVEEHLEGVAKRFTCGAPPRLKAADAAHTCPLSCSLDPGVVAADAMQPPVDVGLAAGGGLDAEAVVDVRFVTPHLVGERLQVRLDLPPRRPDIGEEQVRVGRDIPIALAARQARVRTQTKQFNR